MPSPVSLESTVADERFGALLDAAVDPIVVIDQRGRIARFNHAAERLFGYTEAEITGRNVSILMPPEVGAEHDGYLRRYRETGVARIVGIGREVEARRRDGTRFPVDLAVGEYQHGTEAGFVGILRDLSERNRLRDVEASARGEIEELNARLAHASRLQLLGEMASGIAHEVNQPVASIAAYASAGRRMLESGDVAAGELKDILVKITAQAERAGQVITGLRKLARRQEPAQLPLDVNRLVEEVLRLVDFELKASGWHLEVHLAEGLPRVLADSVQLQQVLLNLVRNSIEAMLESSTGDRVEITTASTPGEVQISVRDCGPGIRPEMRDRLFQPFQTSKTGGMGLGLSICQSIVQAHRGRLELLDDGQPGACFVVRLPAEGD